MVSLRRLLDELLWKGCANIGWWGPCIPPVIDREILLFLSAAMPSSVPEDKLGSEFLLFSQSILSLALLSRKRDGLLWKARAWFDPPDDILCWVEARILLATIEEILFNSASTAASEVSISLWLSMSWVHKYSLLFFSFGGMMGICSTVKYYCIGLNQFGIWWCSLTCLTGLRPMLLPWRGVPNTHWELWPIVLYQARSKKSVEDRFWKQSWELLVWVMCVCVWLRWWVVDLSVILRPRTESYSLDESISGRQSRSVLVLDTLVTVST